MRISPSTIDAIKQAADIVEVVEDFFPLKKKGTNWWALSPFTNEKTPSFAVNPAKGIFKCFSTGKGGDSISFIMEMEGVGYVEALRHLAAKYGIEIEEEKASPEQEAAATQKDSLYAALTFAARYFQEQLRKTDEGRSVGLSYFKERGLIEATIEGFELGYSLDQWNAFEAAALKQGYKADILEQAGLVVARDDGKRYDRFRGRVMFPIHNVSGRVVGFGARTLKADKQAKYLNSPETDVYRKSEILYGLFQAKKAIRNLDSCLLVEGYMDVVSLHQAGVEHAVASSGTSLTDEQIRLMKRFTSNVTVLYDGDAAGVRAAMRGIDMLLEQGLNVRVVQFPDGHDPDSYVRAVGGQAFKEFLKAQSQDFILFKTNMFLAEAAGDPIRKGEAIRDIVQSIARIPDPIKQAVFYQQCASLLGVDEALLAAEGTKWADEEARRQRKQEAYRKGKERPLGEPARKPLPEPPLGFEEVEGMVFSEEGEEGWGWDDGGAPIGQQEEAPMWVDGDGTSMPLPIAKADPLIEAIFAQEQETIRLLLLYGHGEADEGRSVADYMLAEVGSLAFRHPVYAPMLEEFRKACAAGKALKSDHFLHHSNPDFRKEAADLLLVPYELNKWPIPVRPLDDNLGGLAYKNLLRLKFHTNKHLLAHLEAELQQASLRNDLHQEQEIMSLYLSLKRQQVEISKITGDFIIV